ncbi:glycosyltransferase [Corynebacterium sanguinis]|uniref:Glycosyltransferase n=1 Tax=Corynebacterium sanguinis TaxID=2594913 RepID=A0A6C1U064_9CORY|nr:glycosyltransferase [Corynebacterium sanguinis]MBA4506079.1 glycosyltransferase [Corynebacterium sanguinis]MCT1414549.1 glycosyltransferase [Corynebacterium sanguinis]MCT1426324.1 glycosyltransferase [Corynebacterium sanguinis]MCT1491667.1 glycosyltransferase [Corynebacterium sanguinis]MCT1499152.1 glycosyltransferase [Corynebacterium sanguinis]
MTIVMPSEATVSRAPGLKIAFVAPARYPIREPYAGGLEAFCHTMVKALRMEGHEVHFFAARGSDGNCPEFELPGVDWGASPELATDTGYPAGEREREDRAFIGLRKLLVRCGYDVVHNNSLSPWMFPSPASPEALPMVTTLHTPVLDELQDVIDRAGADAGEFAAVSHATASNWRTPSPITVIPNGVNVSEWTPGPGGAAAVWFGRLVPEKGPHLAIDACRLLGLPLLLAGRKGDHRYFQEEIAPRLNGDSIRWLGELSHAGLRSLVGSCAVTVVTPRWEEPFGLVAFESMACGTPVAAFARGGLGELLAKAPAALAQPDDVVSLAKAIHSALHIKRPTVREWVVDNHSLIQTARRYTDLYREVMVK